MSRAPARRMRPFVFLLVAACSSPHSSPGGDDEPITADAQIVQPEPHVTIETITDEHRAIPGAMFGGWGPHLGHLVAAADATYWVDDVCSPTVAGDCDVNVDRRVAIFRRDATGWTKRMTLPLPGVQQNTAALSSGGKIYVYGIASAAQRVVECIYDPSANTGSCNQLAIETGAGANYVGASVAPNGARVAWWTNVVDGGGGSFSYIVNYSAGWNGPRTGAVGGYNDCSYAHVAFTQTRAEFFCEVTTGLAPNWTFSTLVGTTASTLAAPVTWANGLAAPTGDRVFSTNDLVADDSGIHLIARSANGDALVYAKTADAYGAPTVVPKTYRARFVNGTLVRDVDRKDILVGDLRIPLDIGDVYAIYPMSTAYQDTPVSTAFAVVGSGNEHRAIYISVN